MAFPVWIGCDSEGRAYIGVASMRGHEIVDREQIYGSQIPHRVVAMTPGAGPMIMTPTEANENEYEIIRWF